MPAAANYGSLPFGEQIAFFRRKLNLPTKSWTDIWGAQHDNAFVVAGANSADIVADFRAAIDKAISQGTTLEQFRKDFDRIVEKYGWQYNGGRNWRSRVIYETNLRSSYMAGRYAQLQAAKKWRPFWQYVHSDAVEHPRPLHLSWDGIILSADDPWWDTHFGPNGWGCKCDVRSLAWRDMKRLGKTGPDPTPTDGDELVTIGQRGPNPRVVQTPVGVDPGFGYTPGRSVFEQLGQLTLEKAARLPAEASAVVAHRVLVIERVYEALRKGYVVWQQRLIASGGLTRGETYWIGALDEELIAALKARGIEPNTSSILASDRDVWHAVRAGKQGAKTTDGRPKALIADELERLPELLENPEAILLDERKNTLLYVFPAQRRAAGKLVIGIDYHLKTSQGVQVVNSFRTASLIEYENVTKQVRDGSLILLRGAL